MFYRSYNMQQNPITTAIKLRPTTKWAVSCPQSLSISVLSVGAICKHLWFSLLKKFHYISEI